MSFVSDTGFTQKEADRSAHGLVGELSVSLSTAINRYKFTMRSRSLRPRKATIVMKSCDVQMTLWADVDATVSFNGLPKFVEQTLLSTRRTI